VVVTDLEYRSSLAMLVRVARLPPDCHGSADALRFLSRDDALPRMSHAVVMPGDLMLEDDLANDAGGGAGWGGQTAAGAGTSSPLSWKPTGRGTPGGGGRGGGCTMVFADVGAKDGNGAPLKESSKAKMGLLSRSEEDAEYVGFVGDNESCNKEIRRWANGRPQNTEGPFELLENNPTEDRLSESVQD
jgi:hypothetical protein